MTSPKRVSVNTSLKNARIFEDLCDDALDADLSGYQSKVDTSALKNARLKLGADSNFAFDYKLTMIKEENITDINDVVLKTDYLHNVNMQNEERPSDVSSNDQKLQDAKLKMNFLRVKSEFCKQEELKPSCTLKAPSADCVLELKPEISNIPLQNCDVVEPSSIQDVDNKKCKMDYFFNIKQEYSDDDLSQDFDDCEEFMSHNITPKKNSSMYERREICDEDSLQNYSAGSNFANSKREVVLDDNTNDASRDSNSNQSLKCSKKSIFARLSPYQRPQLERLEITSQVDQCAKNLSGQFPSTSTSSKYESDPEILSRRQKQIDFGKNTIGYDNYIRSVPRHKRTRADPSTPNKLRAYSRRGWDSLIKHWRLQLHNYD